MASILIVEQEDLTREILCCMTAYMGHRPIAAANRRHSIELMETIWIDAMISNLQLSDGTGFEVCAYAFQRKIPCGIIADSAGTPADSELERMPHLYKPICNLDWQELIQTLLRYV